LKIKELEPKLPLNKKKPLLQHGPNEYKRFKNTLKFVVMFKNHAYQISNHEWQASKVNLV
jgi:hypothetical protein